MSDWYTRAMARAREAQSPSQQRPSPYQPQQQVQPQWPGQTSVSPQQMPQTQMRPDFQAKQGQASLSETLAMQAQGLGTPGIGARLNPNTCPNCGDKLFFENLTKGARRGPPPAPHCFACGYNGLFEQGLQSTWQGGV